MNAPITATVSLQSEHWQALKMDAIFRCCKWDLNREDHPVLAPYALVLDRAQWALLSNTTRRLAREGLELERELLTRPAWHRRLGLPRSLRSVLRKLGDDNGGNTVRVVRFDFHYTTDGWRISEANADVPGGFVEASGITQAVARSYPGFCPTGDPARSYAEAIARRVRSGASVALVHATSYADDRQVMECLAQHLRANDLKAIPASPSHLRFDGGRAAIDSRFASGAIDGIVRFFPAEWLPKIGWRKRWSGFFSANSVVLSNPATAILQQSKRMPLVLSDVSTHAVTWRNLMPKVRCPREILWSERHDWVLKPGFGRVGEGVAISGVTPVAEFDAAFRRSQRHASDWVAQKRFHCEPIPTPEGPRYACLGVFAIDGEPSGCYGRVSAKSLIDADAQDIAVLLRSENANGR